jgi:Arc/MetJ-type ribon-helix-helix transcriptional regulator
VSTQQIAVRLPAEQLEVLDGLVTRGVYPSCAAAVRAGIDALVELDRRRRDDRSIVEGYRRIPPTSAETAAAIAPSTWCASPMPARAFASQSIADGTRRRLPTGSSCSDVLHVAGTG